jgi:hypothetical protein
MTNTVWPQPPESLEESASRWREKLKQQKAAR